jgi:hypothetical protein
MVGERIKRDKRDKEGAFQNVGSIILPKIASRFPLGWSVKNINKNDK